MGKSRFHAKVVVDGLLFVLIPVKDSTIGLRRIPEEKAEKVKFSGAKLKTGSGEALSPSSDCCSHWSR